MLDPKLEAERFKTDINLSEYAAACGYRIDRRESSRNCAVMRHASGDKIIIARGADRHFVYYSVRDEQDHGSIIDFIQRRTGQSLGHVRQSLRPWIGEQPIQRPKPDTFAAHLEPTSRDLQAVAREVAAMPPAVEHAYLKARGIGREILTDSRFVGRVLIGPHHSAAFPHEDQSGVCGCEFKNDGFTGFSKGGDKGLWHSHCLKSDKRLVFTESAIDALSYHALFPDSHTRYFSTGGGWSPKTRELMRAAVLHHPGPEIVLAFDADDQGRKYEAEARALLEGCGKTVRAEYPSQGKDWNEQLQLVNARIRELAHSRIQECSTKDHASRARRSRTQNEERER